MLQFIISRKELYEEEIKKTSFDPTAMSQSIVNNV
jgi:hypothetical protein